MVCQCSGRHFPRNDLARANGSFAARCLDQFGKALTDSFVALECRLLMLWTVSPPGIECHGCRKAVKVPVILEELNPWKPSTTIGSDIAKSVFQVHGIDAEGNVILRRQLKRRYVLTFFQKLRPCLVGIEACASSHHWSRELQTPGHTVRLRPPAYVKPYVKRHKNDATDAEAICEAVTRPNMRFVATKDAAEQQSCPTLHHWYPASCSSRRSRPRGDQRHARSSCRVWGIVAPVGRQGVEHNCSVLSLMPAIQ